MTATTQPHWAADLLDNLDQQQALYEQLTSLSAQQTALVQAGDTERLLALLGRRQLLIDRLAGLSARLEPFKRDWADYFGELDESDQRRVGSSIQSVQAMLDQIMAQDDADRAALSARRDQTARQLKQTHHGAAVNRAYGAARRAAPANRFTDQQG